MIDLYPFCKATVKYPDTDGPWAVGKVVYATNGHIIVRVPESEAKSYGRSSLYDVPKAKKIEEWFDAVRTADLNPIPIGLEHFIDGDDWAACTELLGLNVDYRYYKLLCDLTSARIARRVLQEKDCIYFQFGGGGEGILLCRLKPAPVPQPEGLPQ